MTEIPITQEGYGIEPEGAELFADTNGTPATSPTRPVSVTTASNWKRNLLYGGALTLVASGIWWLSQPTPPEFRPSVSQVQFK